MHSSCLRVDPRTKARLDDLKIHPKESYNDVIGRLVNSFVDDEPLSDEEIQGIEEALEDLKKGRHYPHSQVRKELGIS